MKSIKKIAIIIIGNWNTKIFTPAWMMSELLVLNENEEIKVGFSNNDLRPIYNYKKIDFIPTERAFEIRIEEISDETLSIANKATLKLINTLPFTPNMLVGYNYSVDETFDVSNVIIPKFSDTFSLNEIKLTKKEEGYELNVILNAIDLNTTNYNFHYTTLSYITENTVFEHISYLKAQWEQI